MTLCSMTITAFAEDGYIEENGIIVETISDKDAYESGDTAHFTIKVTNTNDYDLQDFNFTYILPTVFGIKNAEIPNTIDYLAAGESATIEFDTVVTSDSEPEGGNFFEDNLVIIIIAAVVVVVVVIAVILILRKKKTASLIVVGALVAGSLASAMTITSPVTAKAEVQNSDYKRVSVHDPSIVKDPSTGNYYVFGSHLAFAKSTDLISWSNISTNVQTNYKDLFGEIYDAYCGTSGTKLDGDMWAPDVIYNPTMGKWCMYMSLNGNNWQSVIVLLTADNIEGPYEYVGGVMYSGFNNGKAPASKCLELSDVNRVLGEGADLSRYKTTDIACVNAIDPNVEYDNEGNLWMTYGSWSAGIWQIKLDNNTGLRDYNTTYESEANKSDPYLGYKIAGGYYNSGEGAYILKTDDYYYLFISIGNLEASGGYNMRVYRSESINGPYLDENGKSSITNAFQSNLGYIKDSGWTNTKKYTSLLGIKLMGAYKIYGQGRIEVAQGHNSAFVDDDGKMYVIYHTRFASSGEGHEVRVHQLFETESGWITAAPYEYSGETLSTEGYTKEQVAGTYDFVIHRPDLVYANNAVPNEGETYATNGFKKFKVNSEEAIFKLRVSWKEAGTKVTDSKGVVYAQDLTLNADGTISGDYTGKWEFTNGANVKMTIDDVEYSGVFIEQQNQLNTRDMTMTFTLIGGNKSAWGVKNPEKN